MSTATITVSSVDLLTLETFAVEENKASEKTAPAKTMKAEQPAPDEFELRRKLFFGL